MGSPIRATGDGAARQPHDLPPADEKWAPVSTVVDTEQLFARGSTELRLRHRGEEYRLRITRQGKLILTK